MEFVRAIFRAEQRSFAEIAAWAYRHSQGLPYVYPSNDLSYTANFLSMIFKISETDYKPHPTLERAFDLLFILHADHEQNCSASAMRSVGSSQVGPRRCWYARKAEGLSLEGPPRVGVVHRGGRFGRWFGSPR